MRFGIEDREYTYDGKMTVEDSIFVYEKSGVGVTGLEDALFRVGNPNAIAAWLFLLMRRAGEAMRWEQVLKLNINTFRVIPDMASTGDTAGAEVGDGAKPDGGGTDPTSRSGKTRRRVTTTT